MASLSVGLSNAESKRELAIEFGVREIKIAAAIQPFHQKLITLISRAQPKAHEVQLRWRGNFKARIAA